MIAIVGAGIAGLSAAATLRELGYAGPVRVFAAEAAVPYERPALSKRFLDKDALDDPPPLWSPHVLAESGVALDVGIAVDAVDAAARVLVTAAGERVAYDQLLLATGAAPRRLSLPGAELRGIHHLRELDDARLLRAALRAGGRVVLVGGGVIGLEVAASAAALGLPVTVLETAPQLMGRVVPAGFATLLAELHEERGVRIRTGVRPVAFEGHSGRVRHVVLEDGETIPADVVVVGVGAVARTELAERAGLVVEDGIVVDAQLRSSHARIFAAGDVAQVRHAGIGRHIRIEQWQPAQEQGRHAAASMLGRGTPYRAIPWMWSDQHELHLQAAGFGFAGLDLVRRGNVDAPTGIAFLGIRDGRLEAACGLGTGTAIARTIRAAQLLIGRDVPLDVDLADPRVDLRRLARGLATQR
jgi:3-phenylpropionate/trans-cinnamate dioxygenase ferredoxin reductase component